MKSLKLIGLSLFSALTIISCDNEGDNVRPQTETDITNSTSVLENSSRMANGSAKNIGLIKGTWKVVSQKIRGASITPTTTMDLNNVFSPIAGGVTFEEVSTVTFDEVNGAVFQGAKKYTIAVKDHALSAIPSRHFFTYDLGNLVPGPKKEIMVNTAVSRGTGLLQIWAPEASSNIIYYLEKVGGAPVNTVKEIESKSELKGRWLVKSGSLTSPAKFIRTKTVRSKQLFSPLKQVANIKALEFIDGGSRVQFIKLDGTVASTLSVDVPASGTINFTSSEGKTSLNGVLINGKTLEFRKIFENDLRAPVSYKFRKVNKK